MNLETLKGDRLMLNQKLIDELGKKLATAYREQKIRQFDNVILDREANAIAEEIWDSWRGLPANSDDTIPNIETILPESTKQKIELGEDKRISSLPKSEQDSLYEQCVKRMWEELS